MTKCKKCSACCYNVSVEVDKPEDREEIEEYVWMLLHENIGVYISDDKWYVEFLTKCKSLDKTGICTQYDERPQICRDYDPENCLKHGEEEYYEHYFKDHKELLKYWENNKD